MSNHTSNDRIDNELASELPAILAEANFEEFPIFTMGKGQKDKKSIVYEKLIEGSDGIALRKKWRVSSAAESLPTYADQDVYLAVLELLERRGGMPEDSKLSFTLHQLLKILGWTDAGKNYEVIKASLWRLGSVVIDSEQAFYHKDSDTLLTRQLRLWKVELAEKRTRGGRKIDLNSIHFEPEFVSSWHANYLRGLDRELYWSLKYPIAKRLYRLVDRMRNDSRLWRQDLEDLKNQLPLANYKYPSKIKEKLGPAHQELMDKGFLKSVTYEGRDIVCYEMASRYVRRSKALQTSIRPEQTVAIERLLDEGLRGDVAKDLVFRFGASRSLECADAARFDSKIRNKAGWIRKALEERYEVEALVGADQEEPVSPSKASKGSVEDQGALFDSDAEQSSDQTDTPLTDPDADLVWQVVLDDVSEKINAPSLRVWFEGAVPVSLSEDKLTLSVPNSSAKEYIEARFREPLEAALARHLSPTSTAVLEIVAEPPSSTDNTEERPS